MRFWALWVIVYWLCWGYIVTQGALEVSSWAECVVRMLSISVVTEQSALLLVWCTSTHLCPGTMSVCWNNWQFAVSKLGRKSVKLWYKTWTWNFYILERITCMCLQLCYSVTHSTSHSLSSKKYWTVEMSKLLSNNCSICVWAVSRSCHSV